MERNKVDDEAQKYRCTARRRSAPSRRTPGKAPLRLPFGSSSSSSSAYPSTATMLLDLVQEKTSKAKEMPFFAGESRSFCFYLNLGDYIATNWNVLIDPSYFFPMLSMLKNT